MRLLAPKRRAKAAEVVFPYLVKAYNELHRLTGLHTQYKMVIYHFPKGSEHGWGGTSDCSIWYSEESLDLDAQSEWQRHRVPHVAGYIEEMAHNFVSASHAQFGWEMVGWSLGAKVAGKVAGNPVHDRHLSDTRKDQARTFERYVQSGCVFPEKIPANLCDRIHAYILWRCEKDYGADFWSDFFSEVRKARPHFARARRFSGDEERNERYRITVDCFDRLEGLEFKELLQRFHISLTTDVKSLHPTDPGWDRRLVPPDERQH